MSVETLIYRSTFIYRNFDVYKCPHFKARRIHVLVTCRRCVLKSLNVDVEGLSRLDLELGWRFLQGPLRLDLELGLRFLQGPLRLDLEG